MTDTSSHTHAHADAHGKGAADGHAHGDSASHGSFRGYMTGFVLAVVLTAIPFWLVMAGPLAPQTTALLVMGFAVAQIVVHMIYFLHMDTKSEGGWTMMALIFTILLVIIAISGSLWVMYHLNTNMMPMNPAMMESM
ncbi:cytochrome o ubiquinol oxidase subunit IV [Sphingomonas montana]|uniref:cytochrome o ubiquinol oxidase subunit IV n=1 Tax=Sphingomonas montana TaxID=1843236 RepID=UPI00096CC742|nr:cytochrome o ubiquinol oxidase subunit IV [Sphingomonas montana]